MLIYSWNGRFGKGGVAEKWESSVDLAWRNVSVQ